VFVGFVLLVLALLILGSIAASIIHLLS
jgi:hypothetical protein